MEEQIIRQYALPINPQLLMNSIGSSGFVMIGDNTHGTEEFYQFRSEMTKTLILEKGFTIVGIEWDWIDVHRINQYVLNHSNDRTAWDAISSISRFPTFMYRNHEFEEFIEWLRTYNQSAVQKVNIYGLDIFGIISTLHYLSYNLMGQEDLIYKILDVWSRFDPNEYDYGNAVLDGTANSVEKEVSQLKYTGDFFLDECIKLVKESEEYYRVKATDETKGWNLRDAHISRVITDLVLYYKSKMCCWIHNTHTGYGPSVQEFANEGKTSAAALLKNRFGNQVYSIGLLADVGTLTASSDWYGPTFRFNLNPAIEGSFEDLFHDVIGGDFMLILKDNPQIQQLLSQSRYERFIGGAYNPSNEINNHYVHAKLYPQFDAIVFFDISHAFELY